MSRPYATILTDAQLCRKGQALDERWQAEFLDYLLNILFLEFEEIDFDTGWWSKRGWSKWCENIFGAYIGNGWHQMLAAAEISCARIICQYCFHRLEPEDYCENPAYLRALALIDDMAI